MQVDELFARTKAEFKSRGFVIYDNVIGNWFYIEGRRELGARDGQVHETYRRNGTAEDVTVTIEIFEVTKMDSGRVYGSKRINKIKIPKNASDRVLKNRIDRAEELLKAEQK